MNVVLTWRHRMKETWTLVIDLEEPPHTIIALYGRRMRIEKSFRDTKSQRWGFRFRHVRPISCERCERQMLVLMLVYLFLMAFGAQAEREGRHRRLMANTVRHRTLSWFTVGRVSIRDYLRSQASSGHLLRPLRVQS